MDKASVYGTGDCRFESYQGQNIVMDRSMGTFRIQNFSAAGTRTRVARVRAEYPNQLDYSGVVDVNPISFWITNQTSWASE